MPFELTVLLGNAVGRALAGGAVGCALAGTVLIGAAVVGVAPVGTELVGKVVVPESTPAAVTFHSVTACKLPAAEFGGTNALSGLTGVGAGLGGVKPSAKGVAPAIQISPTESTAAAVAIAKDAMRKKIKPDALTEKSISKYLYAPQMRDVDLFLRSSGEQRTSNFLMWQSAYAEMVFLDVLWPDADRRTLWRAIEIYAERERRFGKA